MLINLNEFEVKFALYAIQEAANKLEVKFRESKAVAQVAPAKTVRLTKDGKPYKKPGRKPGRKPSVKIVEQVAA